MPRRIWLAPLFAAACATGSDEYLTSTQTGSGSGSGSGSGGQVCAGASAGSTCATGSLCCTSGGVLGCFSASSCDRVALEGVTIADVGEAGVPSRLESNLGSLRAGPTDQMSAYFVASLSLAISDLRTEAFHPAGVVIDQALGRAHVRVAQSIRGIPVDGARSIVEVEPATGAIRSWTGDLYVDDGLPTVATLTASAALAVAAAQAGLANTTVTDAPALVYAAGSDSKLELSWRATVQGLDGSGATVLVDVYASAADGGLVDAQPVQVGALERRIYGQLTGVYLSSVFAGSLLVDSPVAVVEGGTTIDPIHQRLYDHLGATYQFYADHFDRDSYDDGGSPLAAVAFTVPFNNAFFASHQPQRPNSYKAVMAFYAGDGVTYGPFATALDVVAHEFTHGVTQYSAGLVYSGESGGLNEAFSDIFAAACEAAADGAVSGDTWKLAEDVYTPAIPGDAGRYMDDPARDGRSLGTYSRRARSVDVHYSSGIANRAFYLLAMGGVAGGVTVPAIGITKAEQIFYRALTTTLTPRSGFKAARVATFAAASDLYGVVEASAVVAAWDAVAVPRVSGGVVVGLVNGRLLKGAAGAIATHRSFRIDVPADHAALEVRLSGGTGNADLTVRRPDGTVAATSITAGNNESVTVATPAAGAYALDLVATAAYRGVSVVAFARPLGAAASELEPNNTTAQPQLVATSSTTIEGVLASSTDVDVFAVTLPAGATLTAAMYRLALGTTDYDVALVNGSGKLLASSKRRGSEAEDIVYTNPGATAVTLYLRVFGHRGASSLTEPYRINVRW